VTLVHKGNIMKYTEGAFRDWGYQVAKDFFGAVEIDGGTMVQDSGGEAGRRPGHQGRDRRHHAPAGAHAARRVRRHRHAEPERRLSIRCAGAQVGGIGIAPGGNINYVTGHAVFEATHGTAPKYADQDKVNPGSVILSGEMMLPSPRLG
jgi:isocitrate dehydrogenase